MHASSKNVLSESTHLEFPGESRQAWKKLSRGLTSKKTEFRRKFYRCKYSFWFRPSPTRITPSTPSIRNNWPSADPPSRDDTSQITEFQTRPSNFHIFFPAMQWKYCARGVPGRYYRKIRKSARVLRPQSRTKPFVDTCFSVSMRKMLLNRFIDKTYSCCVIKQALSARIETFGNLILSLELLMRA